MKKKLTLALGLSFLFIGCSNNQAIIENPKTPNEKKQQIIQVTNNLPQWVINPKVEGGISGVGIAGYSKHGMQIMLPQAEMDARSKLAGQIKTVVSQVQKASMRHVKINELDELDNSFKQASKEVIKNMPLSGVKRINMFQAQTGDLYVLSVIEKREVSNHLSNMKSSYAKHMRDANLSKQAIDEGMKVLDSMINELDKEME